MAKKITAFMLAVVMVMAFTPAMGVYAYSVQDAYDECAAQYPEFVNKLFEQDITEAQIIRFLNSVYDYLQNDIAVEVTEDNFEECMMEAVRDKIFKREHVLLQRALSAAFPEAATAAGFGEIHPDFIPLFETVKKIVFENDMLGTEEETEKPTDEEVEKPTEKPTEAPTEKPTEAPTEKPTEAPTEKPTEASTEKPTEGATEATENGSEAPTESATASTENGSEAPTENGTEAPTVGNTERPTGGSGNEGGFGGIGNGSSDEDDVTENGSETSTEMPTEGTTEAPTLPTFSDMHLAAWANEAVGNLVLSKVISGYPDGTFKPNNSITRAEFATIIVKASGRFDANAENKFTDVKDGDWFKPYVTSAYSLGFINGRGNGIFDPNSNITRADICTIVYKFIKSINSEFKATTTAVFTDSDKIPEYAREAVNALYSAGIISGMGDGSFAPTASATRAQSAKIVYGALNVAFGF